MNRPARAGNADIHVDNVGISTKLTCVREHARQCVLQSRRKRTTVYLASVYTARTPGLQILWGRGRTTAFGVTKNLPYFDGESFGNGQTPAAASHQSKIFALSLFV